MSTGYFGTQRDHNWANTKEALLRRARCGKTNGTESATEMAESKDGDKKPAEKPVVLPQYSFLKTKEIKAPSYQCYTRRPRRKKANTGDETAENATDVAKTTPKKEGAKKSDSLDGN